MASARIIRSIMIPLGLALALTGRAQVLELDHSDIQGTSMLYSWSPALPNCGHTYELQDLKLTCTLNTGSINDAGTLEGLSASLGIVVKGGSNDIWTTLAQSTLTIAANQPEQVFTFDLSPYATEFSEIRVYKTSYFFNPDIAYAVHASFNVEQSIHITPYSDASCFTTLHSVAGLINSNQVHFSWGLSQGCPCWGDIGQYRFELLRLFNDDPDNADDEQTISCTVDWTKALSIETGSPATSLDLTLAEGTGFYVWRVRPIAGKILPSGTDPNDLWPWSTAPAQGNVLTLTRSTSIDGFSLYATSASSFAYFFYNQFDNDRNWIYNRMFTEPSVRDQAPLRVHEGMTYATGLQQVDQTQTHMASTNSVLAAQTVEDLSGRPAVQSLPVPIAGRRSLGYVDHLLDPHETSGAPVVNNYTALNFDTDPLIDACDEVETATGPGYYTYYSTANTTEPSVPSADHYPLARTLFHPDGRVMGTSGPGSAFALNGGDPARITRTFYADVCDEELDYVFGNQAYTSKAVHNVLTTDPNGIVTSTYQDKEGKVLATSLISTSTLGPDDDQRTLWGLDSEPESGVLVNQYIGPNTELDDHTLEATGIIHIEVPSQITFHYQLDQAEASAGCQDYTYCATCDYHVEIRIVNAQAPYTELHTESFDQPAGFDPLTCGQGPAPAHTFVYNFTEPGIYKVIKHVTTNNVIDQNGNTALDVHLHQIQDELLVGTNAELQQARHALELLETPGMTADAFYTEMGIDPAGETFTIPLGCESATFEIERCDPGVPDPAAMLQIFADQHDLLQPDESPIANVDPGTWMGNYFHYPESGNSGGTYDFNTFSTLIDNMMTQLDRTGSARLYSDAGIQSAWVGAVIAYLQEFQNSPSLMDLFLDNLGRHLVGHSTTPGTDTYTTTVNWSNIDETNNTNSFGYLTHAYAYFYRANNTFAIGDQCYHDAVASSSQFNGYFLTHPLSDLAPPTDPEHPELDPWTGMTGWDLYFGCTSAVQAAIGQDIPSPQDTYTALMDQCHQACFQNSAAFRSLLLDANSNLTDAQLDEFVIDLIDKCVEECDLYPVPPDIQALPEYQQAQAQAEYAGRSAVFAPMITKIIGGVPRLVPTHDPSCFVDYPYYDPNGALDHEFVGYAAYSLAEEGDPLNEVNNFHWPINTDIAFFPTQFFVNATDLAHRVNAAMNGFFQFLFEQNPNAAYGWHFDVSDAAHHTALYDIPAAPTDPDGCTIQLKVELGYLVNPQNDWPNPCSFTSPLFTGWANLRIASIKALFGSTNFLPAPNVPSNLQVVYDAMYPAVGFPVPPFSSNGVCHEYGANANDQIENGINQGNIAVRNTLLNQWSNGACPHVVHQEYNPNQIPPPDEFVRGYCLSWNPWSGGNVAGAPDPIEPLTCEQINLQHYHQEIAEAVAAAVEHMRAEFTTSYATHCASADHVHDVFYYQKDLKQHHYTLYYYDRAGNLMATVAPKGVHTATGASSTWHSQTLNHDFRTNYTHNSLGQVVEQNSPDGGTNHLIYDRLGRVRFSRSAKQQPDKYSYTLYDALGRVVEAGESQAQYNGADVFSSDATAWAAANDAAFPTGSAFIVHTTYSIPASDLYFPDGTAQTFLDNRVSYSTSDRDGNAATTDDRVSTYYSYDVHGNVDWLAQEIPGLGRSYMHYQYDLISGRVLQVDYNPGMADQYFQRYTYDADGRLTCAETSTDGVIWDKDASYTYYPHGPLHRTEIGEDKVQGIDMAYTIQGWLKGINSPALASIADPGHDAGTGDHANVGRDAFGMMLSYYNGDYTAADPSFQGAQPTEPYHELYNGNIAAWASNSQKTDAEINGAFDPNTSYIAPDAFSYRYDELNRIRNQYHRAYQTGSYSLADQAYHTTYTYDGNGNITNLTRSNGLGASMDALSYNSIDPTHTNQLGWVDDASGIVNGTDLGDQAQGNYTYDASGELTKDVQGGVDQIDWTPSGKVDAVHLTNGHVLRFLYDAAGHRVAKREIIDALSLQTGSQNTYTLYVNDAQGNAMATYKATFLPMFGTQGYSEKYTLLDQAIYGSDRLGLRTSNTVVKRIDHPYNGTAYQLPAPGLHYISEVAALDGMRSSAYSNFVGHSQGLSTTPGLAPPMAENGVSMGLWSNSSTNVYRAEDEQGHTLFSCQTYRLSAIPGVMPETNLFMLLDRQNHLIYGSPSIRSAWNSATESMPVPGHPLQHYIFTIGADGKPYAHVLDLAVNTYGSQGEVTQANISLWPTGEEAYTYAPAMAVLDDRTTYGPSVLYLRRMLAGTTQVLAIDMDKWTQTHNVATSTTVLATLSNCATKQLGEMQVSPHGEYLALSNKLTSNGNAWQDALQGGPSALHLITLGADHTSAVDHAVYNATSGKFTSLDFSPSGNYLYFVNSAVSNHGVKRIDVHNFTGPTAVTTSVGDIRHTANGHMLLAGVNNQYAYTFSAPDDAVTVSAAYDLTATVSGVLYKPQSALALQPLVISLNEPVATRTLQHKQYELKDHLGNVRLIVSDRKLCSASIPPTNYHAEVLARSDYYPFGMLMPGRNVTSDAYRFGFNGKEKDDEVHGSTGTSYDFGARLLDPRVGRWLSLDPYASKYPSLSPYSAFGNNSMVYVDPGGETLRVAGNLVQAMADLRSLLPESHQAALELSTDGTVTWNADKVKYVGNQPPDAGVELMYRLILSDKKYEYNVSKSVKVGTARNSDGSRTHSTVSQNLEDALGSINFPDGTTAPASNNQLVNASKTIHGGRGLSNTFSNLYEVPLDGNIDGQVSIAPSTDLVYSTSSSDQQKPRSSIVFHELWENYLRTDEGQRYPEAHAGATIKEQSLPTDDPRRDTNHEGEGTVKP